MAASLFPLQCDNLKRSDSNKKMGKKTDNWLPRECAVDIKYSLFLGIAGFCIFLKCNIVCNLVHSAEPVCWQYAS